MSLRWQAQGGKCEHGRSHYHPAVRYLSRVVMIGKGQAAGPTQGPSLGIPRPSTGSLSNSSSPFFLPIPPCKKNKYELFFSSGEGSELYI